MRTLIVTAALAAACMVAPLHSLEAPEGCMVIGQTNPQDEGFPLARCVDGSLLYLDLDGEPVEWTDASGYAEQPVYPLD